MVITLCNPHRIMFESVSSRLHSSASATKLLRAQRFTRALLAAVATACLCAQVPAVQGAESAPWPARPIHLVVPFAAGTFVDVISRIVGSKLADALGQAVVIDNRPGASGNIASELVAKAPPDGYTLLNGGVFVTMLPAIYGAKAIDPAAFVPITRMTNAPMVIVVHPSLGVSTLADLAALARTKPGRIAYATSGIGTTPHLAAALWSQRAGVDLLHVPYANTNAALKDVLSGEVPVLFTFLGTVEAFLRADQLKALAVTSAKRDPGWATIPTVAEQGYPGFDVATWSGLLAPAGTPPEVVDRIYREVARILQQSDVREKILAMGNEPVGNTPEQFAAEIRADVPRWKEVASKAGIRAE
jgi:tripartite-type tricarboxylate transporter receptor subunit TctC